MRELVRIYHTGIAMLIKGAKIARSFLRIQDAISYASFLLGATALGLIVVIYAYEVVSRYLFGSPTMWASDFVSFLLLILVFLSAPWLTHEKGHVSVTILPDLMSATWQRLTIRMGYFVAAAVCLWAGWICLGENFYLFKHGTLTLTTVRIPKWVLSAFITYGLLNTGLYFLRLTFESHTEEVPND